MGWKAIKDHYRIEHLVEVTPEGISIGRGPNISIVISSAGRITKRFDGTNEDLARYQAEMDADTATLERLATAVDVFERSIPVYTYDDDGIVETACEQLGYPNMTHGGVLMYDNSHSGDKEKVVQWAKENAAAAASLAASRLMQLQEEAQRCFSDLEKFRANIERLDAQYPHIVVDTQSRHDKAAHVISSGCKLVHLTADDDMVYAACEVGRNLTRDEAKAVVEAAIMAAPNLLLASASPNSDDGRAIANKNEDPPAERTTQEAQPTSDEADLSVVNMVLDAVKRAQQRLAERSARRVGNMSVEFPPYESGHLDGSKSAEPASRDRQFLSALVDALVANTIPSACVAHAEAGAASLPALLKPASSHVNQAQGPGGTGLSNVVTMPLDSLMARPTEQLAAIARLAAAAGGGDWSAEGNAQEASEVYVYHEDGDAACKCLPHIGALPDAIGADDIANFLSAVSPAKMAMLASDFTRVCAVLNAVMQSYGDLIAPKTPVGDWSNHVDSGLNNCPGCGGHADNGHSRDVPPVPYHCSKCSPS